MLLPEKERGKMKKAAMMTYLVVTRSTLELTGEMMDAEDRDGMVVDFLLLLVQLVALWVLWFQLDAITGLRRWQKVFVCHRRCLLRCGRNLSG